MSDLGPGAPLNRAKAGRPWRIGDAAEVDWIGAYTRPGMTIASAIPTIYDAYATIVVSAEHENRTGDDRLVVELLTEQSGDQPWWLGYLETGSDDVVFPDAGRVRLYAHWPYVLIEAGPEQALTWRESDTPLRTALPDLIFPADHSWLLSTLWDDDWRCLGGPAALIEGFTHEPRLTVRQVTPDENATPPGHVAR